MITGACGDFLDELKVSLDKLQNTVDAISLEQIKTNKKVDKLEEKISLEQRKTNKKVDQLEEKISLGQIETNKRVDNMEEKIEKLGSKVITVEDLNEVNNNISDAIDQLKDEMKTSLEKFSEYGCNEPETNVPNLANGNLANGKWKVELRNGGDYNGNVYALNREGFLGPVCDDVADSNDNAANVVCRQLGFNRGVVHHERYTSVADGVYAMDQVTCTGNENSIQECSYVTEDNCGPTEAFAVQCYN